MFGLKQDWSLHVLPRYFTLEDYEGGTARWCPGCGDHGVLSSVQRICRDEQLPPEKTVCVSGIGCSSRFPHYMKTYGFHGLHGRALPVACGVKARRPDLSVWVATGDGDCCSIGAAHWIHAIRYNMKMVVMLFNNAIYGLTKMQSSPTTPTGYHTNTHPGGAPLPPMNPAANTLGFTNVSFVAQTVDWNPVHVYETLKRAFQHNGLAFVHILQRCPQYTSDIFKAPQEDPDSMILLEHDDGIVMPDAVRKMYKNKQIHNPSDLNAARAAADIVDKIPIGLLFQDESRPRYDEYTARGVGTPADEKLASLERVLDTFAI